MGISPFLRNIKKIIGNHLLDGLGTALSGLGGLLGSLLAVVIYDLFFFGGKMNAMDFFSPLNP